MTKEIHIQTQGVQCGGISPVKPVGFIAINLDGIKITLDAYHGSGCYAEPRTDSLITIIDEKECFELSPAQLLQAVRFFHQYNEMGGDVVRFKNVFHVIMPDRYKTALKVTKRGLKV